VTTTADFSEIDLFRDKELPANPYPFYDWIRSHGPVWYYPLWDVWLVTGHEEVIAVYHDQKSWSNCNTVSGPFVKMSVPLEGDDITDIIREHRDELPFSDQLPSFDPPEHTAQRGLLMRLITPKRLKENEAFLWSFADETIDTFVEKGACELLHDYAVPYTLMVIADLLGVPDEDRDAFLEHLATKVRAARMEHKPLEYLYEQFTRYIEERRANPQNDVMTEMAHARFPDGSLPPVNDVMRIAANLFSAGSETTARLIGMCLRTLGDHPEFQQQLREDTNLVMPFVEEMLRTEAPLKGSFKLSRIPVTLGGIEMPAGTTVFVMTDAASRDPRQFECPNEFRLDRTNGRQHLAFGHGIHTCAGAPLARAETHATIVRFLDRMSDIRISEKHHGPAEERRYEYDPTYMLRGLKELHLEFTPSAAKGVAAT
jgi:cytochrome P450 family 150 subfamily A5